MMADGKLPQDLKTRTRKFAVRIVKLYGRLPKSTEAQVIGKQLLRSGTSVGAQYHEGFRSRSLAESISKLESALQELEESDYWIRLLGEAEIVPLSKLTDLLREADELTAILTTCAKRVKAREGASRTTKNIPAQRRELAGGEFGNPL